MYEDTKRVEEGHTIKIEQHEPKRKPDVKSYSREG